jgi:hypothetical protein
LSSRWIETFSERDPRRTERKTGFEGGVRDTKREWKTS